MNQHNNTQLMKKQTIGVEIELAKISKEKVMNLVYAYFMTKYQTGEKLGFIGGRHDAWACKDHKGRKWQMMDDGSASGRLGHISCELVTPILTYEDIEDLQCIVRILRENGAKSGNNYNAGVHVHIGADIGQDGGQNPHTIRNLVNIMASHEKLLLNAVDVSSERYHWCKLVNSKFLSDINTNKPRTMDGIKTIWYTWQNGSSASGDHYNQTRYHMLNLHAIWDKGTIEFRLFEFKKGLHAGELKAWIQLCLAICSYAKCVSYASPKPLNSNNEKYIMKNWLVNMGLIGDEFKTCRLIMTRKLNGDCAYANGRTNVVEDLDDLNANINFADANETYC